MHLDLLATICRYGLAKIHAARRVHGEGVEVPGFELLQLVGAGGKRNQGGGYIGARVLHVEVFEKWPLPFASAFLLGV